jgi:hypothetical protein
MTVDGSRFHRQLFHCQLLTKLERRQLFLRIRTRIDLRIRLRDLPVLVDQVRDAPGVFVFR